MSKRVTSSDVARAAGVSRTTVSFVLNEVTGQTIPEVTRRAVLQAVDELGYLPSVAATALRAGGTNRLVLCLAPEWEPAAIMDESLNVLTRELRALGFATVVAKAAEDPASLEAVWRTVDPSAVIAMFDLPPAVRDRIARMKIPLFEIFFHSYGGRAAFDDVQRLTGRLQADHLLDRGADELVYVYPGGLREPAVPRDRLEGVQDAAAQRGRSGVHEVLVPSMRGDAARRVIRRMLETRVTGRLGVCAYNDVLAIAVISECHRLGLNVPGDVLVMGVDDDAVTESISPTVSSVRFSAARHMRRIAHQVVKPRGDSDMAHPDNEPAAALVVREST